jgi:hypothetical protein
VHSINLYYADLDSGLSSTFSQPAGSHSTTTGIGGFRVRSPGGLGIEVEYGVSAGTGSTHAQSLRAAVKMAF